MRLKFFYNNLKHVRNTYISRISTEPVVLSPQFNNFAVLYSENPNFKIWKRWHLGHSHDQGHEDSLIVKEGEKIFHLGLGADIGLAAGKALTGYLSGSTAIIADAAHSVSDVVLTSFSEIRFSNNLLNHDIFYY